jgi:hypothetical protein
MGKHIYITVRPMHSTIKPEFDDNDLFENNSSTALDLSKATADTYKTLDPYTLSIYNISVLKKAVKLGYDVNKTNKHGVSLLHCYARKNPSKSNMNTVKYLLDQGASPFLLTNKGISVLDIAMKYNQPVAKLLIKKYGVVASDEYKKMLGF